MTESVEKAVAALRTAIKQMADGPAPKTPVIAAQWATTGATSSVVGSKTSRGFFAGARRVSRWRNRLGPRRPAVTHMSSQSRNFSINKAEVSEARVTMSSRGRRDEPTLRQAAQNATRGCRNVS